ncbi:App1 family protein [Corynebacterium minutissimum]|uniref:App1 family protein n=1 Tax=uncultured Corynebacterium sp. TaxID=159447 RepID=UPI0025F81C48|nr:phosphatase domain-containing protein [uncultured Corynebacterium sp.]
MALSDIARKIEFSTNSFTLKRSARQGWRPSVTSYSGYGNADFVHVLGRVLMHDPESENSGTWAQRGYRQFFTIQVPRHEVEVTVGRKTVTGTTNHNGYIDVLVHNHGLEPGWHEVTIRAKGADEVTADVLIVGEDTELGVVSDIDDTIMVTWLPRAMIAAWNSWVKRTDTRTPVAGMARFYRKVAEEHPGVPFIYLSTGAWNTYDTLVTFMEENGFPRGPLLLTDWGPTPTGLFRNGQEHKRVQLRNLFIAFPKLRWLLIGDDGQHDPLTYADATAEHPDRVAAVAIRNLSPQEQLLSHGSLAPLVKANETGSFDIPLIQGADGHVLARAFRTLRL